MNNVKKEIQQQQEIIENATKKIQQLQNECTHPEYENVNYGDMGHFQYSRICANCEKYISPADSYKFAISDFKEHKDKLPRIAAKYLMADYYSVETLANCHDKFFITKTFDSFLEAQLAGKKVEEIGVKVEVSIDDGK